MNRARHGISLLEVMIATGMLAGSLVVLSELTYVGRRHLDRAEEIATATRLSQNKLGELLTGLQPMETVEDEPIEEDPNWFYSVDIQPMEELALVEVRVRVRKSDQDESELVAKRDRLTLIRWIFREESFSENGNASPGQDSTGPWMR
ncbi:MAG: hypothetical protein JW829_20775 [Pirellulales bacterium]|nr:hypothetical protein [Pirellulales bacterium]